MKTILSILHMSNASDFAIAVETLLGVDEDFIKEIERVKAEKLLAESKEEKK